MINILSKSIIKVDENKQAYVGYCEETKQYYSYSGNMIRHKQRAMRIVNPDLFINIGLKPIKVK